MDIDERRISHAIDHATFAIDVIRSARSRCIEMTSIDALDQAEAELVGIRGLLYRIMLGPQEPGAGNG